MLFLKRNGEENSGPTVDTPQHKIGLYIFHQSIASQLPKLNSQTHDFLRLEMYLFIQ